MPRETCNRCGDYSAGFYSKGGGKFRPECKRCTRAHFAGYYRANRTALIERQREFRRSNRDKILAYDAARDRKRRRASGNAHYASHRIERSAASARRYASNRERILAQRKRRYLVDHDELRRRAKEHRRKNPESVRASEQKSRALRANAKGRASAAQIKSRVDFYGGRCAYCGGPYEHLDHVIPLSRGGMHVPSNLRPACAKCNLSKHAKKLSEWRP